MYYCLDDIQKTMKEIVISLVFAISATFNLYAQMQVINSPSTEGVKKEIRNSSTRSISKSNGDLNLYYSEDFGNGFETPLGNWEFGFEYGDAWFITFPEGTPNGYNISTAITSNPTYGNFIPNFAVNWETPESPSADNGFAMIDMDRLNSVTPAGQEPGSQPFTQNPIVASLTSPPIDLSATNYAELIFYQSIRICCVNFEILAQISEDGENWISHDVFTPYGEANEFIEGEVRISISDFLSSASDKSAVRVRFLLNGMQSHYYWMIDDVKISQIPANDLILAEAWANNFKQYGDDLPTEVLPFYRSFEYLTTPIYNRIPLRPTARVINNGSQPQYNVVLKATVTNLVSLNSIILYSVPLLLDAGDETLISTEEIILQDAFGTIDGDFSIDFEVQQTQDDISPEDNVSSKILQTSQDFEDNNSIFSNGVINYGGTFNQTLGYRIFSTAHAFNHPDVGHIEITHVEFVIQSTPALQSEPGNTVYLNVRRGLPSVEIGGESTSEVIFDSDNPVEYDSPETEYIIQDDDIWNFTPETEPNWVSFELPNPVIVNPDSIYFAEIRIPDGIPVFPALGGNTEPFSTFLYLEENAFWVPLNDAFAAIRFRTRLECPETVTLMESACESFELNEQVYYTSGQYNQEAMFPGGCSGSIELNLTILDGSNSSDTMSIVSCGSYIYDDIAFYQSGTYPFVYTSAAGCDSTVILDLTIESPEFGTTNIFGCDSVIYGGETYFESGFHTLYINSPETCDSIITLSVDVISPYENIEVINACESFTWLENNEIYTLSGTYSESYQSIFGCDSTQTLQLVISDSFEATILEDGQLLQGSPMGDFFSWLDCATNTVLSDGSNNEFIVEESGEYAVAVTIDACTDTSDCLLVIVNGLVENELNREVSIFPNPTSEWVSIATNSPYDKISISLFSADGKRLIEKQYTSSEEISFRIPGAAGTYLLVITEKGQHAVSRILKL
jgi:hypothetical protein